MDIDLSSQSRGTTPFCYGPVMAEALLSAVPFRPLAGGSLIVVATTRRNGTRSLLTSAKLSIDYLVVGITRELDKEPSLH